MNKFFIIFVLLFVSTAYSKAGIIMKFLPSAPEDSVAKYDIYRDSVLGQSKRIGTITVNDSISRLDTVSFSDTTVSRGTPYWYSVTALNAAGANSERSTKTKIGIPKLEIVDTLKLFSHGDIVLKMDSTFNPLGGGLKVEASHPLVKWDTVQKYIIFSGNAVRSSGINELVIIKASYYDKFFARDTVRVIIPKYKIGTPKNLLMISYDFVEY